MKGAWERILTSDKTPSCFEQCYKPTIDFTNKNLPHQYAQSLDEALIKFIEQSNNELNVLHQLVIEKVQDRLTEKIYFDFHAPISQDCINKIPVFTNQDVDSCNRVIHERTLIGNRQNIYVKTKYFVDRYFEVATNAVISDFRHSLHQDIDVFTHKLKKYQQNIEFSIETYQEKLNTLIFFNEKYVSILNQVTNVIKDLKFQQEYF
jgi:hypothetical protein